MLGTATLGYPGGPAVPFRLDPENPGDYLRLCRSCHKKFDQTPESLAQLARARAARGGGA